MRVVVAMDSFKGSLDSLSAGRAVAAGVRGVDPQASVTIVEIADGGEGTLAALMHSGAGQWISGEGVDALGRPIQAEFGLLERDGRRVVVIESARTIGIGLVEVDDRLPARGSSYGLGAQVRDALSWHPDEMLIGLGGSATTDGGAGLLVALGARLLDRTGRSLGAEGNPLWSVDALDVSGLVSLGTTITALTDVTNPLCGPEGAATVFGPQKGATDEQVAHLDAQLRRWALLLRGAFGIDVSQAPGAGAAGGIAGALMALGARAESGFDRIAAEAGLAEVLRGADLVFTGEGSLDAQSRRGKVPVGVARLAGQAGAVCVALAGRLEAREDPGPLDAAFPIHSQMRTLVEATDPQVTARELARSAGEVTRLVLASRALRPT